MKLPLSRIFGLIPTSSLFSCRSGVAPIIFWRWIRRSIRVSWIWNRCKAVQWTMKSLFWWSQFEGVRNKNIISESSIGYGKLSDEKSTGLEQTKMCQENQHVWKHQKWYQGSLNIVIAFEEWRFQQNYNPNNDLLPVQAMNNQNVARCGRKLDYSFLEFLYKRRWACHDVSRSYGLKMIDLSVCGTEPSKTSSLSHPRPQRFH